MILHNSQGWTEMEMMSVCGDQMCNVITVWLWNLSRGNWSCDGLGILLVPRLGWHVRFFREAQGSTLARCGQDLSHNEHRRPNSFQLTLFIMKAGDKHSAYIFLSNQGTKNMSGIRNTDKENFEKLTNTYWGTCQKGAPLWNRTFWNCQEKHTPSASKSFLSYPMIQFCFYDPKCFTSLLRVSKKMEVL